MVDAGIQTGLDRRYQKHEKQICAPTNRLNSTNHFKGEGMGISRAMLR